MIFVRFDSEPAILAHRLVLPAYLHACWPFHSMVQLPVHRGALCQLETAVWKTTSVNHTWGGPSANTRHPNVEARAGDYPEGVRLLP